MKKKIIEEEYITGEPMTKKKWTGKRDGLQKLLDVAKFNEQKAIDDQEEIGLIISTMNAKIDTFK